MVLVRVLATRNQRLILGRVGDLALIVAGQGWDDEEWLEFCEHNVELVSTGPFRACLTYAPLTGPSMRQREIMMTEYAGIIRLDLVTRFALLSDSIAVRGIVTAMNWFVRDVQIKYFSPVHFSAALKWLSAAISIDTEAVSETMTQMLRAANYASSQLKIK